MLRRFSRYRERRAQIEAYIEQAHEEAFEGAETPQQKNEAGQLAHSFTEFERCQLGYLRQEAVLRELKNAPFVCPRIIGMIRPTANCRKAAAVLKEVGLNATDLASRSSTRR
jgi:hypothetical protein